MARTKRKINHLMPQPPAETASRAERAYRAGGYARLSVEDSGKAGSDTMESQKKLITDYIESRTDMELCAMHCDNGQTGVNFDRPGFESLMQDVKSGKIDCIVVKDLSRFGRNYRETGNYLERVFPFLGIRFVAVADGFDTLTAERTGDGFIVPLKNIMNEAYSKDISRKSGSALAAKQRRGEFIGTWAAYGYKKCAGNPHRIEPDEETAPVVEEIFRLRSGGMSYRKIAVELNRRGIPSPSRYHYLKGDAKCQRYAEALWQAPVVKKILSSRVYLGHMVQGRKYESLHEGKKQRMRPESEWIIVHNTHKPIVDEGVFAAVQEMAESQKAASRERAGKYGALGNSTKILKKLVYCADCGRPMIRYKHVNRKATKATYSYLCRTHTDDPDFCGANYIQEKKLLEILWETLEKQIAQAVEMEGIVRNVRASAKQTAADASLEREAEAAARELERARALYEGLYPLYALDKAFTEQEYMQMRQEYRARMENAENGLDAVAKKRKERAAQMEENPWLKTFGQYKGEKALTEEIARALISRVDIGADKNVKVALRWQDEYRALAELLEKEADGI